MKLKPGLLAKYLRLAIGLVITFVILITISGCQNKLQVWPGYPVFSIPIDPRQHWLVLKCTYSDERTTRAIPPDLNPVIPDLDTYINAFLTVGGAGTGNLIDYYRDVTYGALSMTTDVHGWIDAPFKKAESVSGQVNRTDRVQQCASKIPPPEAAGIDFESYWGIIIVTNDQTDAGACDYGQKQMKFGDGTNWSWSGLMACVVLDPFGLYTSYAAQEVGHGWGMRHSYNTVGGSCGGAAGEYCDGDPKLASVLLFDLNNGGVNICDCDCTPTLCLESISYRNSHLCSFGSGWMFDESNAKV